MSFIDIGRIISNNFNRATTPAPTIAQTGSQGSSASGTTSVVREFRFTGSLWRGMLDPTPTTANADPSPWRVSQLASQYAPIFIMHPDEKYMPADPDEFIRNSSVNGNGDIEPGDLQDPSLSGSRLNLSNDESVRDGDLPNAPVLYNFENTDPPQITYYVFTNYNNYAINNAPDQNHEGDWERVTLVFGNGINSEPTQIRYSAHNGGTSLPYSEAPKDESGRPIVFVAKGSHALSPYVNSQATGTLNFDDSFGFGDRFDPLATRPDGSIRLENVTDQAWWGSNVKWGEEGSDLNPLQEHYSGPTGPTPENSKAVGSTTNRAEPGLVDETVQRAIDDPTASADDILTLVETLYQTPGDLADEYAQDFVEMLWNRGKLDDYAATPEGREVLQVMAEALDKGSTHGDEVETYNKIQDSLRVPCVSIPDVKEDA